MKTIWVRVALAYFAASGFVLGLYATIAPRSYFDNFPGAGHAWVAGDGVYNEHLMRDYGALNLALGVVALCALVFATRELVIATAIAEIVYAVPHIIYHAAHPSRLGDTSDQFGAIGGLAFGAAIAVVLLLYALKTPAATPASRRP